MTDNGRNQAGMVCLGIVTGAHGLRGELKVRSFTADPAAIAAYGPLTTDGVTAQRLRLTVRQCRHDHVIVAIEGIEDRTAAEVLRGVRLFVERTALPDPAPDEYYFTDLIGLAADLIDERGGPIEADFGRVRDVADLGGGPVLDIMRPHGASLLVPFTRAAVPVIDLAAGRLTVVDLPGLMATGGGERVADAGVPMAEVVP